MRICLGTRGSRLARAQGDIVRTRLEAAGVDVEWKIIQTSGDRDTHRPFQDIGAPGIFVRQSSQAPDGSNHSRMLLDWLPRLKGA